MAIILVFFQAAHVPRTKKFAENIGTIEMIATPTMWWWKIKERNVCMYVDLDTRGDGDFNIFGDVTSHLQCKLCQKLDDHHNTVLLSNFWHKYATVKCENQSTWKLTSGSLPPSRPTLSELWINCKIILVTCSSPPMWQWWMDMNGHPSNWNWSSATDWTS